MFDLDEDFNIKTCFAKLAIKYIFDKLPYDFDKKSIEISEIRIPYECGFNNFPTVVITKGFDLLRNILHIKTKDYYSIKGRVEGFSVGGSVIFIKGGLK